jgi:hypothetical protein
MLLPVNSIFCFGWTFRFFGLSDGSINCFIGSKFQVPTVATVEFTIGYSRFFVITKFISKLTKRQFRKSILIFILHWAVVFTHLKKQHVALGGVFSIFLPKIFFFFFFVSDAHFQNDNFPFIFVYRIRIQVLSCQYKILGKI